MALPPQHFEIARWKNESSTAHRISLVLWRYEGRYSTFGRLEAPTERIDLSGPVRASNDRQAIAMVEHFNRERSIRRVDPLPGVNGNCVCGIRLATNPDCTNCASYRHDAETAEAKATIAKLGAVLERNPPQGLTPSEVADFFQRNRAALLAMVLDNSLVMPPEQHIEVGLVVELIEQPLEYGRSLNGTLGRIERVLSQPGLRDDVVVQLYRAHKKTGRPLALRSAFMPASRVRVVSVLTPEEADLLRAVEPAIADNRVRLAALRKDAELWRARLEAQADRRPNPADSPVDALRRHLVQHPPAGWRPSEVADFFAQRRSSFATAAQEAEIAERIESQWPFVVSLLGGPRINVIPDVDGLWVDLEGRSVRVGDTADDLISYLASHFPDSLHLAGSELADEG